MKVIIIGAGASGLIAAINAAKNGADVTVLEHENKSGKKILVTGNGKCNITNTNLSCDKYYGNREFVEKVLNTFSDLDTLEFFNSIGLYTKDKSGYIYPLSEQASSVINRLRDAAMNIGVVIKLNNTIKKIEKTENGFDVHIGIVLHCDKLIIATGGKSFPQTGSTGEGYRWAESFGHSIKELKPALTALICHQSSLSKASGVRIFARINVETNDSIVGTDLGEIQITDYGISGIPVFNISRLAEENSKIIIDFMPNISFEKTVNLLTNIFYKCRYMSVSSALHGCMNDKLATAVLHAANIDKSQKADKIDDRDINCICTQLKSFTATVKSRRGFDFAQTTQGGINTNEINSDTMESKLIKNLYFAGEILDVDGICGGYNLQFAWSTGAIAGGNCK